MNKNTTKDNSITVQTEKGIIEAHKATDPNYPGIWISINGQGLVLVELNKPKNIFTVRAWDAESQSDEDCVYLQKFSRTSSDTLSFESDIIKEFQNGEVDWTGEVLAKYEFGDNKRVLQLETNGEPGNIFLEVVDYSIVNENLYEDSFSDPIHEIKSEQEIEELFLDWLRS